MLFASHKAYCMQTFTLMQKEHSPEDNRQRGQDQCPGQQHHLGQTLYSNLSTNNKQNPQALNSIICKAGVCMQEHCAEDSGQVGQD